MEINVPNSLVNHYLKHTNLRANNKGYTIVDIFRDFRDPFLKDNSHLNTRDDVFDNVNRMLLCRTPELGYSFYDEPIVEMVCDKCLYEEEVSHHILVELNYGNKSLHALACPMCSHTRKKGTLYPKDITDINGNPITYKDVLNSK